MREGKRKDWEGEGEGRRDRLLRCVALPRVPLSTDPARERDPFHS